MQLLYCLGWILLGAVLSLFYPVLNVGQSYGWFGNICMVAGGVAVLGGLLGIAIIVVGNVVRVVCGSRA